MSRLSAAVPVSGLAAVVLHAVLVREHVHDRLAGWADPEQRAELLQVVEDIRWAAERALADRRGVSANGHADIASADLGARSSGDDEISAGEAGELLGCSARHLRRLAQDGLGVKVGGRWRLSRVEVLLHRETRGTR